MDLTIHLLIILVLILAWLGILILVAFLSAILEAKLYNPSPRKTRQRHRRLVTQNHTCDQSSVTNMVTTRPAISADQQASQSPNEDDEWLWKNIYNPEIWS